MKYIAIALITLGFAASASAQKSSTRPVPPLDDSLSSVTFCINLKQDKKVSGKWALLPTDERLTTSLKTYLAQRPVLQIEPYSDAKIREDIVKMMSESMRDRYSDPFLGVSIKDSDERFEPGRFYSPSEKKLVEEKLAGILQSKQQSQVLSHMGIRTWTVGESVRMIQLFKDISVDAKDAMLSNLSFNYAVAVSKYLNVDCDETLEAYFDEQLKELSRRARENVWASGNNELRAESYEGYLVHNEVLADRRSLEKALSELNNQRASVGLPAVTLSLDQETTGQNSKDRSELKQTDLLNH